MRSVVRIAIVFLLLVLADAGVLSTYLARGKAAALRSDSQLVPPGL